MERRADRDIRIPLVERSGNRSLGFDQKLSEMILSQPTYLTAERRVSYDLAISD